MSDQLLVVLQICLLALVYLVFLRVVRAVWVELRAEGPAPAAAAARPRRAPAATPAPGSAAPLGRGPALAGVTGARLVVVAPPALVGHAFTLEDETTIGRAPGCGVPIDDAHVSKLHARLHRSAQGWVIEDLGSTNGTFLDGAPVHEPTPIVPGGRIQIGDVVLELS